MVMQEQQHHITSDTCIQAQNATRRTNPLFPQNKHFLDFCFNFIITQDLFLKTRMSILLKNLLRKSSELAFSTIFTNLEKGCSGHEKKWEEMRKH